MRKKSKRTKGIEQAHPFDGMSRVNPHTAGADIGADEIVVCVSTNETTQLVRGFGNYTIDLHAIADWLAEHKIKTVAMESTGVYWIPLFEVLEQNGFECLLISSRSLRRVPGRKSEVTDAQWIQTLHNYGLLESSFRPQADLISLRPLLRHRRSLVDHRPPHVLHMQKALLQMNIQLSQAVSDVTGVTGQAIIRAILSGVRSPKILASLREPGCKKSEEEIATPALHQTQCGASVRTRKTLVLLNPRRTLSRPSATTPWPASTRPTTTTTGWAKPSRSGFL